MSKYGGLKDKLDEMMGFAKQLDMLRSHVDRLRMFLKHYDKENYEQAIDFYLEAMEEGGELTARQHYQLADSYYGVGDKEYEIMHLCYAVEKDPTNHTWFNYLGNALTVHQDMHAAEDAFKQAVQINPKYDEAWCNLGLS